MDLNTVAKIIIDLDKEAGLDLNELEKQIRASSTFTGILGNVGKAMLPALALGGTYAYLHHAANPAPTNVDALYEDLKKIEPHIGDYPKSKAMDFLKVVLENDPTFANRPRTLGAVLSRLLPYPSFPYEELIKMKDLAGLGAPERAKMYAETGKNITDSMKNIATMSGMM
jgi:hypothetical protein